MAPGAHGSWLQKPPARRTSTVHGRGMISQPQALQETAFRFLRAVNISPDCALIQALNTGGPGASGAARGAQRGPGTVLEECQGAAKEVLKHWESPQKTADEPAWQRRSSQSPETRGAGPGHFRQRQHRAKEPPAPGQVAGECSLYVCVLVAHACSCPCRPLSMANAPLTCVHAWCGANTSRPVTTSSISLVPTCVPRSGACVPQAGPSMTHISTSRCSSCWNKTRFSWRR